MTHPKSTLPRIATLALYWLLLLVAPWLAAQDAHTLARRALLAEDYPTARTFAARIPSLSERDELLGLIRQCELDTECDVVSAALTSPPPPASLTAHLESMIAGAHRTALISASRARALLDVASVLRSAVADASHPIFKALEEAAAKDAQNQEQLEKVRQQVREATDAAVANLSRHAAASEVNAAAWRITDCANGVAAIEKQARETRAVVAKAEAVFTYSEWKAIHDRTEAAILAGFERAAYANGRMLYLLRNIADARTQVEQALASAPTSRRLLQLKVKVEEWNTRHRIMGDKPNK